MNIYPSNQVALIRDTYYHYQSFKCCCTFPVVPSTGFNVKAISPQQHYSGECAQDEILLEEY
jgi:hypothetical protein